MAIFRNDTEAQTAAPTLTFDQLKELVTLIKDTGDTSGKSDLSLQLLADLKDSLARTVPKANMVGTGLSPFTIKEGCRYCDGGIKHEDGEFAHPKPRLRFEAYHCGIRLRDDLLTVSEVELLNAFDRNCEARKGKWTARIKDEGGMPKLYIEHPANDILKMADIPPLTLLLMELLHGKASVDPNNLHMEIQRLREEVDRLNKMAAA
jgi:hypothetical protein